MSMHITRILKIFRNYTRVAFNQIQNKAPEVSRFIYFKKLPIMDDYLHNANEHLLFMSNILCNILSVGHITHTQFYVAPTKKKFAIFHEMVTLYVHCCSVESGFQKNDNRVECLKIYFLMNFEK